MLENARPRVFARSADRVLTERDEDETLADEIDSREVFDILSSNSSPPALPRHLHLIAICISSLRLHAL
ncbi:unnamed protein product [Lampetra planeri]